MRKLLDHPQRDGPIRRPWNDFDFDSFPLDSKDSCHTAAIRAYRCGQPFPADHNWCPGLPASFICQSHLAQPCCRHLMNRTFPEGRLQHMRVFLCARSLRRTRSGVGVPVSMVRLLLQRHGYRRDLVHRSSGRSGTRLSLRTSAISAGPKQLPIIRVAEPATTAAQFNIVKQRWPNHRVGDRRRRRSQRAR